MKNILSKLRFFLLNGLRSFFPWVIIFFITFSFFPCHATTNSADFPFSPGEKLTFNLKWCFIPAGEAVLEVLPMENISGIWAYHFALTVKTNPFFDAIYKVRDKIDSYADIDMTRSILYKKSQAGRKHQRDVVVNFNWDKNEAQYSNFGRKRNPVSLLPGSFDPLSIFYYSRMCDFNNQIILQRPVTDGKKCVIGTGEVIKRETIKLKTGKYDTYLLQPELKDLSGVFRKSENATIKIWLTADKRKIPVRIKSNIVIGSFVGELVPPEDVAK
ncbi:MAG: DUF3108 domain-containing protein [Thermodesulfobacteriota bacterium]|nr:DUF3108 domain-containing protein [Thermodesulfobacteriota bacterium]